MTTYKKTVKKYNNKKSTSKPKDQSILSKTKKLLSSDKNNYSTGNKNIDKVKQESDKSIIANSKKPENKVPEKGNSHPQNSNLKKSQNQDTLAHRKDKTKSIIYCIIALIITIIAILIIPNNQFNKSFTNKTPEVLLCGKYPAIIFFIIYFISSTFAVTLITLSNKTDNHAYEVDIMLYTILYLLCFTLTLLIYQFNLFLPAAIISIVATIISIYMCYRYYVSFAWSGILQTLATLFLLYSTYIFLAFSL